MNKTGSKLPRFEMGNPESESDTKGSRREFLWGLGCSALWSGFAATWSLPCLLARPLLRTNALPQGQNPESKRPDQWPLEIVVPKTELAEATRTLRLGESSIEVRICGDLRSPFRYVVIHGDEETAPRAVAEHLLSHAGCLIQLLNPGERLVSFRVRGRRYELDPNRIFTPAGIERNLNQLNRRVRRMHLRHQRQIVEIVRHFADELLGLLVEPREAGLSIIAVHNNGTGPRSNFSFETFVDANGYFQGVEAMHYHRSHSPFNLFVVTDRADFEELMRRDLNVVLENSEWAADDGSLSVLCGREKIRYANVETRMGELARQVEMLNLLREIWDSTPKTNPPATPATPSEP